MQKAQQRPSSQLQALFLCPQFRVMAAVRGRSSGLPGSFCPGLPTCVQLPPIRLVTNVAAPISKRSFTMTALIPSKIRALAHRRMALAALHANSSLSTRLKRYNHHMHQVRVLETHGGAL